MEMPEIRNRLFTPISGRIPGFTQENSRFTYQNIYCPHLFFSILSLAYGLSIAQNVSCCIFHMGKQYPLTHKKRKKDATIVTIKPVWNAFTVIYNFWYLDPE